jgi:tetratricopeptide (TPR) repeat protein
MIDSPGGGALPAQTFGERLGETRTDDCECGQIVVDYAGKSIADAQAWKFTPVGQRERSRVEQFIREAFVTAYDVRANQRSASSPARQGAIQAERHGTSICYARKISNKRMIVINKLFYPLSALTLVLTVFFGTLIPWCGLAWAENVSDSIAELQHIWAKAYYQVPADQKEAAFKDLAIKAHQVTTANPDTAGPMVWEAIILSSYAKFAGGLGALEKAKAARDLLERAEKIQPDIFDGSIYTSLGSLYYKVPRWPISFGDKKKAREYLEKAVKVNPAGIDANFFYGEFLLEQGEYAKAREYLEKALAAPTRPGREDADQGRRVEVQTSLDKAKQHS